MNQPLDRVRVRSALDDFLGRTVVHEETGARMPGRLIACAVLGAVLTAVIGVLGVLATQGQPPGFGRSMNDLFWVAAIVGALLIGTAIWLARSRSLESRDLMRAQLVAGAVVPTIALIVIAAYVAITLLILWLMAMAFACGSTACEANLARLMRA